MRRRRRSKVMHTRPLSILIGLFFVYASSTSIVAETKTAFTIQGTARVLTVTKTSDTNDGVCNQDCSLREAIAASNSGDTIAFASGLAGQRILLTQGQLTVDKDLIITGAGAALTIIDGGGINRVLNIPSASSPIKVTISDVTITGGKLGSFFGESNGGGIRILNSGANVTVANSIISGNSAGNSPQGDGGGIFNAGAMLTLINSTVSANMAFTTGGGISNINGTVTLLNTVVTGNSAGPGPSGSGPGGGIFSQSGTLTLINSTVSNNRANGGGGGIAGTATLRGTVVTGNQANSGGGLSAIATMQNTIIAKNTAFQGPDCSGSGITSLGHNIIGTTTGCSIALQSSDQVGDPLLGDFIDPGSPGNGRFSLRSDSPAIDAGDNAACAALSTDQLGQPRSVSGSVPLDGLRICDIGAAEFFLPVDQLVHERTSERFTQYDPTPLPGAPAGTFLIIAKFDNISDTVPPGSVFENKTIFFPFFEVAAIQLSRANAPPEDQPVLLNADRGPGRVGARLTAPESLNTPFPPGATGTFQFLIGLQKPEPFVFFVNMLGEPRSSNSSASAP